MHGLCKDIQPEMQRLLIGIRIISLFLILLTLSNFIPARAQCPDLKKDDYQITIQFNSTSGVGVISAQQNPDKSLDLVTNKVQLYNYEDQTYYWDDGNTGVNGNIRFIPSAEELRFENLPSGDYAIILKKEGCKDSFIGFAYSGLPHVGMRLE